MFSKIIIITLLPLILFSYELNFSKKFFKEITPDVLRAYTNVSIENNDESYINDHIEIFNDYISENSEVVKKNGSYTLTPTYQYNNHKQEFIGYIGRLRYLIESNNAININKFIQDFISLKNKFNSDHIKVRVSNSSWAVSQKLHNYTMDKLRLEAIGWIEKYAKNLNKRCIVKIINIDTQQNHSIMSMERSFKNIAPTQDKKQLIINPSYTLECQ